MISHYVPFRAASFNAIRLIQQHEGNVSWQRESAWKGLNATSGVQFTALPLVKPVVKFARAVVNWRSRPVAKSAYCRWLQHLPWVYPWRLWSGTPWSWDLSGGGGKSYLCHIFQAREPRHEVRFHLYSWRVCPSEPGNKNIRHPPLKRREENWSRNASRNRFLGSLLGTRRSVVTVPEVFAKANSGQFPSRS